MGRGLCGSGTPFAVLRVADLGSRLPFDDGAFDDVVASLVLHYLGDWGPALAELRRVLTPGSRLIVSVHHPFDIHEAQRLAGRRTSYFATCNWTEEWTMGCLLYTSPSPRD